MALVVILHPSSLTCVRLHQASTVSFENTLKSSVLLPSLCLPPAAFHVTTIPRRATPFAPNAKSGTVRLLTLVLCCFFARFFLTHRLRGAQRTSCNLQRCVCSLRSLQEESLDLSRSCQTVWTRQDRKVCPNTFLLISKVQPGSRKIRKRRVALTLSCRKSIL